MKFFSKERLWTYVAAVFIFLCWHWNSVIDWTRFYFSCENVRVLIVFFYTSLFCAVFNFWMETGSNYQSIKIDVIFCCLTKELEWSPLHFVCCFTAIAECGQNWLWSVLCEYAWSKNNQNASLSPLCPWNLLYNLSHKLNFSFFHPIIVVPWSLSDRSKPHLGHYSKKYFLL